MDDVAVSNRCLWDVTQLYRMNCETVGDVGCGRRVRVPFEDSIQGYQWLAQQLRPMDLYEPSKTDFDKYATHWEQRYSVLIDDRTAKLSFVPVVNYQPFYGFKLPQPVGGKTISGYPVIAHYGTAWVQDIIVRREFATKATGIEREKALEAILDQQEAYVEENYPGGGWGPFAESNNLGPNRFVVLTDPEGRILANLGGFGSEPGLESEDPLSYLMVGSALLSLARLGGKVVLRMLAKRALRKAAIKAETEIGREMVKSLRAEGKRVVVNIGGTGEEAGAINLNPNVVAPRKYIPQHIPKEAEGIGELFDANTIDEIVSNRLPPNTIDWTKVLPGAQKVLKPGAKIVIKFQGVGGDARIIRGIWQQLGFTAYEDTANVGALLTLTK